MFLGSSRMRAMIFSTAAIANGSTIGTKRQHGVNLHDSSPHGINLHDGRSGGINLNGGSSHGVNLPAGDKNHPCCFRHLFLTTVKGARPHAPRAGRP